MPGIELLVLLRSDEIAMVGDRLDADIGGARLLGIYSIWIKRRAKLLGPPPYHPDAVVETLGEIPPLLYKIAGTSR